MKQHKGVAVEWLGVLCAVFWALLANNHFYQKALGTGGLSTPGNPLFLLGLFVLLASLNSLLVVPLLGKRWAKPLLNLLLLATAFAVYFIQHYNVYLDADMLRNAVKSDPAEASEMISSSMIVPILLYGVLPAAIIWMIPIRDSTWGSTIKRRLIVLVGAAVLFGVSLLALFQPLSSLMRNHKEARYLITPANYIYGFVQVAKGERKQIKQVREVIGADATLAKTTNTKPFITVMVVGETVRAANWGLNNSVTGYPRMTTPELAKLDVVNFTDVTACGTNTEVSLPCMFAPMGRRDYDENKIRRQQSALHVLARAGVAVRWRDNQSGCKGVCAELPVEFVRDILPAQAREALCEKGGHCKDEGLLYGFNEWISTATGNHILVMHHLGSHGPAYYKRYPNAFDIFAPACQSDNLRDCDQQHIVNAYDNTLLYADSNIAAVIKILKSHSDKIDSNVLYVSDHGESLGEKNLFLHGMPYAIAPDVQKKVPLVMWFSEGMKQRLRLNDTCLYAKVNQPITHDHVFHTLLSLTQVTTALYDAKYDLLSGCIKPSN